MISEPVATLAIRVVVDTRCELSSVEQRSLLGVAGSEIPASDSSADIAVGREDQVVETSTVVTGDLATKHVLVVQAMMESVTVGVEERLLSFLWASYFPR
jgi:hypothetical protein